VSGFSSGCGGSSTILSACSGSSTVGQLTNQVGLQLARDVVAVMSCLAGAGAHLSGFAATAKECERLVAPPLFDGRDHRCALEAFERVGVSPHVCLNFTEEGFVKQHGVALTGAELGRACSLARKPLEGAACSTAS
jgi:uncharacterized metal-binding protein